MGYLFTLSKIYIFLVIFDFLVSGWYGKGICLSAFKHFFSILEPYQQILERPQCFASQVVTRHGMEIFFSESDLYSSKSQNRTKNFFNFHLRDVSIVVRARCTQGLTVLCEAINLSTETRKMQIQIIPSPHWKNDFTFSCIACASGLEFFSYKQRV